MGYTSSQTTPNKSILPNHSLSELDSLEIRPEVLLSRPRSFDCPFDLLRGDPGPHRPCTVILNCKLDIIYREGRASQVLSRRKQNKKQAKHLPFGVPLSPTPNILARASVLTLTLQTIWLAQCQRQANYHAIQRARKASVQT